jgi:hypothetical protein
VATAVTPGYTGSFPPFRSVEGDRGANELSERPFVNRLVFANVDGPSGYFPRGSN